VSLFLALLFIVAVAPAAALASEDDSGASPAEARALAQERIDAEALEQGIPILGVPLFAPVGYSAWAFVNLVWAALGIFTIWIFSMRNAAKRRRDEIEFAGKSLKKQRAQASKLRSPVWMITAVVLALAGIVVFILTQDMTLPIIWIDVWTIANLLIYVATIAVGTIATRQG